LFIASSARVTTQRGFSLAFRRTLKRRDWLALPEDGTGILVHDVHRERDY
jgi:NTE family protein